MMVDRSHRITFWGLMAYVTALACCCGLVVLARSESLSVVSAAASFVLACICTLYTLVFGFFYLTGDSSRNAHVAAFFVIFVGTLALFLFWVLKEFILER